MIKGHTKIELTDVSSGVVETFEDTNLVTNAVSEVLNTGGLFDADTLYSYARNSNGFFYKLFGGLFLFDSALPENVNQTLPPAGVKMVGNGYLKRSNSGAITELGSYNTTESGFNPDGSFKYVYDFSTAQANGVIESVCLTSKEGGAGGLGNSTSNKNERITSNKLDALYSARQTIEVPALYAGFFNSDPSTSLMVQEGLLYGSIQENALYVAKATTLMDTTTHRDEYFANTKKIKIQKLHFPFSKVDLSMKDTVSKVLSEIDITVPDEVITYLGTSKPKVEVSTNRDTVYFTFSTSTTVAVNKVFYVLKVNPDFTTTLYKVTNNTGSTLSSPGGYSSFFTPSGKMYVRRKTGAGSAFFISLSDSTQVTPAAYTDSYQYVLFAKGELAFFARSETSSCVEVYDCVRNIKSLTNLASASEGFGYRYLKGSELLCVTYATFRSDRYNSDLRTNLRKLPFYLATINNLQVPVTKTPAKTMKITYTLSFE